MATCIVDEDVVVQQLNELFGNVLSIDVITTVACQCSFDGKCTLNFKQNCQYQIISRPILIKT